MLDNLKDGLGFTGVIITSFKLNGRKINFLKKLGLNPSRENDLFEAGHLDLFKNKFGELFSEDKLPFIQVSVALRHQYINDILTREIEHNGVEQIVILGAGFDIRSETYKINHLPYFEVDIKEVLDIKRDTYQKHGISPNAVYVPIDYIKENLVESFQKYGGSFDKKTLFIWEGNSMYISKEDTSILWDRIYQYFKEYSLVMDFFSQSTIDRKAGIKEHIDLIDNFAKVNAYFITGYDDIGDFCSQNNLNLIETHTMNSLVEKYKIHDKNLPVFENYSMCYAAKKVI